MISLGNWDINDQTSKVSGPGFFHHVPFMVFHGIQAHKKLVGDHLVGRHMIQQVPDDQCNGIRITGFKPSDQVAFLHGFFMNKNDSLTRSDYTVAKGFSRRKRKLPNVYKPSHEFIAQKELVSHL